jgi:hypothetical protein
MLQLLGSTDIDGWKLRRYWLEALAQGVAASRESFPATGLPLCLLACYHPPMDLHPRNNCLQQFFGFAF